MSCLQVYNYASRMLPADMFYFKKILEITPGCNGDYMRYKRDNEVK